MANLKPQDFVNKPIPANTDLFVYASPSSVWYNSTIAEFLTFIKTDIGTTDNLVRNVGASTDNAVALFDGATGKVIKNSVGLTYDGTLLNLTGNIGIGGTLTGTTGTFTGTLTGITEAVGENSTKMASTKFVKDQAYSGAVTSSTVNQLTVATGTTTPALSIVTGAIVNNQTHLATANIIFDYVAQEVGNYLPLIGGTLTGGLIGTTANFSGDVTVDGNSIVNGSILSKVTGSSLSISGDTATTTGANIILRSDTNGSFSTLAFQVRIGTVTALEFASTGGATFSDRVNTELLSASSGDFILTRDTNSYMQIKGLVAANDTEQGAIRFMPTGTITNYAKISGWRGSNGSHMGLKFFTLDGAATFVEALHLEETGIATFSGDVSTRNLVVKTTSNNNSFAALSLQSTSGIQEGFIAINTSGNISLQSTVLRLITSGSTAISIAADQTTTFTAAATFNANVAVQASGVFSSTTFYGIGVGYGEILGRDDDRSGLTILGGAYYDGSFRAKKANTYPMRMNIDAENGQFSVEQSLTIVPTLGGAASLTRTFELDETGAATFSSSVGMAALTATSGNFSATLNGTRGIFTAFESTPVVCERTSNVGTLLNIKQDGGSILQIISSSVDSTLSNTIFRQPSGNSGNFIFQTGGSTTRLTITDTGESTFTGDTLVQTNSTNITTGVGTLAVKSGNNNILDHIFQSWTREDGAGIIVNLRKGIDGVGTSGIGNWSGHAFAIVTNSLTRLKIASGGAVTIGGTVTAADFILSSDMRQKNLIEKIGGDIIEYIKYTRKGSDQVRYGVSAQQVKEVMPDVVHEDDAGRLSVSYIDMLCAEIVDLKSRLSALEL